MDAAAIRRLIRQTTGHDVTGVRDVTRGLHHRVYLAHAEGGQGFVVRIRHHGDITLEDEAWAIERCARAGARVPTVRAVAPIELDGREVHAMVQEAVPGRALLDLLPTLRPEQLRSALHQAGEQLALVHTVRASGFGRHRVDRGWDHRRWEDAVRPVKATSEAIAHASSAGLSRDEVERALALLEEAACLRCDRPALCHGDFTTDHMYFDANVRLTGIIDFGSFRGACPEYDHASFEMERGHAEAGMLLAGYLGVAAAVADDFPRRLDLACIRAAWNDLVYSGSRGKLLMARARGNALREVLGRVVGAGR